MFFVACSDEDTTYDIPETPEEPVQIYRPLLTYNTLCTEEQLDSDAQSVTAKQTFSCQDSLLTQLTYEQSLTAVELAIHLPTYWTHTDMPKVARWKRMEMWNDNITSTTTQNTT